MPAEMSSEAGFGTLSAMDGAPIRIHVTGASGAGVSTLGRDLAARLGLPWLDTDDFYWAPTDPPYTTKRPIEDRIALMRASFGDGGWIVSGSMDGWGDPVIAEAGLVVFLETSTEIRLERLRRRERAHFGARIDPGGDMHENHEAFIAWAAGYDAGTIEGRNRVRHMAWLARLPMPVIRLDGERPTADLADEVIAAVGAAVGAAFGVEIAAIQSPR
jgi:adenylate kinase family enzyme